MKKIIFTTFLTFVTSVAFCQAGISVSPGRVYYNQGAGTSNTQSVNLANPTDKELEIVIGIMKFQAITILYRQVHSIHHA